MIDAVIKNIKSPSEKNSVMLTLYTQGYINFSELLKGLKTVRDETRLNIAFSSGLYTIEDLQAWKENENRPQIQIFKALIEQDIKEGRPYLEFKELVR